MKIHAYLLCYNEEFLMKSVLDYYSEFCSQIFLLDNNSTDRSIEIANTYKNVKIISWSCNDQSQRESLYVKYKTQTFKDYSREGGKYTTEVADWIIGCDFDEILYHENLIELLKKFKERNITVPTTVGFNVINEEYVPNNSLICQCKFGFRRLPMDKLIIWDVDIDMDADEGCHPRGKKYEELVNNSYYKTCDKNKIALLHCKYMGSRWLDVAKASLPHRKVCFKKDKFGNLKGPGLHYLHQVNDPDSWWDRINSKKTRILSENLNVLFKKFNTKELLERVKLYKKSIVNFE